MNETTAISILRANVGKRRRTALVSEIAHCAFYLYRRFGDSYQGVAERSGKSESAIQLWVKLYEALSSDRQLRQCADSGLILPVPLYRIVSYYDEAVDRLKAVRSFQGLGDMEVRLVLECLRKNPGMTIEECKHIMASKMYKARSNGITITLSDTEYRKLVSIARKRHVSIPMLVRDIVDENLGAQLNVNRRVELSQKNRRWSVSFPIPADLRKALDKYARAMGKTPTRIIEETLRKLLW